MQRIRMIITCALGGVAVAALATSASAQVDQQQQPRGAQLEPIVILFSPGSAELDRPAQQGLEETALMVADDERQQMFIVLVVDEADPLAAQRTMTARRHLERAGIAPERIRTAGPDEALRIAAEPGQEPVIVQLTGPEAAGMQQPPQPQGMQQQPPPPQEEDLGEAWQEAGEATAGAAEETGEAVLETGDEVGEAVVDTTARPGMGIDVSIGGGVYDFLDGETRDFTDLGGMWEARAAWTMSGLGVEAAYVGSYQDIEALGLDEDASLVGTGAELAGRYSVLPDFVVQPYVLAGVGFTHYDLTNATFNTSNVGDSDNVFYIPLAAGAMYDVSQTVFLDARFTVRPAFDSDLINAGEEEEAGLDSWSLAARGGFRF